MSLHRYKHNIHALICMHRLLRNIDKRLLGVVVLFSFHWLSAFASACLAWGHDGFGAHAPFAS